MSSGQRLHVGLVRHGNNYFLRVQRRVAHHRLQSREKSQSESLLSKVQILCQQFVWETHSLFWKGDGRIKNNTRNGESGLHESIFEISMRADWRIQIKCWRASGSQLVDRSHLQDPIDEVRKCVAGGSRGEGVVGCELNIQHGTKQ